MENKLFKYCIAIILLLSVASCNNNRTKERILPIISCENGLLNIAAFDKETHTLNIKILEEEIFDTTFIETWKGDTWNILKAYPHHFELALLATSSTENIVPIKVKVDNDIDTIIDTIIEPIDVPEIKSKILGECAPLIHFLADPTIEVELKKWLFKERRNVGEYRIKNMLGIIRNLRSYGNVDFLISNDNVPFIKNFSGCSYSVETEMKADYYVLFAHSSDSELEEFVEEVVSNNFELTSKSVGKNMTCYRKLESESGYKCISLIGINNDWSYQIEPLGLVCIDNIAPFINPEESQEQKKTPDHFFIKKNNVFIVFPENMKIIGSVVIGTKEFRGDDAQFVLYWGGDVKTVSIKREVLNENSWSYLKSGTKTIDLSKHQSPYYFTYKLDLRIGDNYIPITATDERGNTSTYNLHIPMAPVEKTNPEVNIDNNIDIWN